MATAKNIVFLANGYNLACALTGFTFAGETEELDATAVCDSGFRRYVQGFKSATLNATGIWDSDTTNDDKIHDVLSAAWQSGVAQNILASTGTVTIGDPAIMLDGSVMTYSTPIDVGSLIFANATWKSNTGVRFGRWLMHVLQAAGTNNGTSVDNGAASTNGGFFQVHLHNDTASDVDVKLQHSTDNASWGDVSGAEILNLSAIHASGSVLVTGTINRYIRAVATVTGGDTILVSAAFARG